jgi:hypothetical protein
VSVKVKVSLLSGAGLALLLVAGPGVSSATAGVTIRFGSSDRNRLEAERLETMRGLAHYLDEAAQNAARQVSDNRGQGRDRRFVGSINDFARQTNSFHERMDSYQAQPWNVANEVGVLNQRASRVNQQIRNARVFRQTYDDWTEVLSVLQLMNRSLQGYDVQVPAPHREAYQPYERRSRYAEGRHHELAPDGDDSRGQFVTGSPLQEFRRLANILDVQSERVLSAAAQSSDRFELGDQFTADLRRFAQQAADLNQRGDAGSLDRREVELLVQQLLEDARQTDAGMRQSNVFPRVWTEWQDSIRLLEQMASLVQS